MLYTPQPNDVIVFGTNLQGFHGAGAAGFAMRGDYRNNWRDDATFMKLVSSQDPKQDYQGNYAVLYQSAGPMMGKLGKGFGIVTVTKPGARNSIPWKLIAQQLAGLFAHASLRQGLRYVCLRIGEGYSGLRGDEITKIWNWADANFQRPNNVIRWDH